MFNDCIILDCRGYYNGLGQSFIAKSFEESVSLMEWILKIIFTAVALGSVFQGGRGNPIFFVGATFGSAIAPYFNLSIPSVAALGMIRCILWSFSLPLNRNSYGNRVLWCRMK